MLNFNVSMAISMAHTFGYSQRWLLNLPDNRFNSLLKSVRRKMYSAKAKSERKPECPKLKLDAYALDLRFSEIKKAETKRKKRKLTLCANLSLT